MAMLLSVSCSLNTDVNMARQIEKTQVLRGAE